VTAPAYWTAADEAEFDVLAWELVRAIQEHAPACESCRAGWPPCPKVGAAIQAALDWQHGRMLSSRAEYLRSGQALADFSRRLGFTPEQLRELQAKWRDEDVAQELVA
jgi:hypothetical protein